MKNSVSLKKDKVFRYVLKNGEYAKGKYIVVHMTKHPYLQQNFFGICVSKKNGNSVARNKLKRWAREAYKLEEEHLKVGYNIIVLYKKHILFENVNFQKVQLDMCQCFEGLNLYEKK